jgi:hypothetical protein
MGRVRVHATFFYALDLTLAAFDLGMADVVPGDDERRVRVDPSARDAALRDASRQLGRLPLSISVGATVSTHDIFAAVDDDLAELVVVDNYGLLLPAGLASDLKHLAIEANVAVLASTTHAVTDTEIDVAEATPDLLNAADTIPRGDSDDRCGDDAGRVIAAKPAELGAQPGLDARCAHPSTSDDLAARRPYTRPVQDGEEMGRCHRRPGRRRADGRSATPGLTARGGGTWSREDSINTHS